MLTASWKVTQLLHAWSISGIFFLQSDDVSFLKVSIPALPPGWATWLESLHQPSPQHTVPVQLCKAVVPTRKYTIPSVPLHVHKQDILIAYLLWLGAEPRPGKHMVDYVHSAPLLEMSRKPRFWTTWLDGLWHLRWQISGVLLLPHPFSQILIHFTHV